MTDELIREVDAELREERMRALWAQYRRPLYTAILAVLLGVAAYSIWHHYHEKRGGELLARFTDAQLLLADSKYDEAVTAFGAIANDTSDDTRTVAEIWQARALVAAQKKSEAIAVLTPASLRRDSLWSDVACIRLAGLDATAAAPCLMNTHDTPLANKRREWHAAFAWAKGDNESAITVLEQLRTSPDTPESARATVSEWLATLRAGKAAE